jgi:hypothetical protein
MFPLLGKLPVLTAKKSPVGALLIGCVFGCIGLAIYFRSLIDFVAPLVFVFLGAMLHNLTGYGWVIGALLAGAYGFCRALESNDRLSAAASGPQHGASFPRVV